MRNGAERERLASAREEWATKMKNVEINLSTAAAKFDAGLAGLAVLQCQRQHQHQQLGMGVGVGIGIGMRMAML